MQSIFNIAEICSQKNVCQFILSPGSRCAPLTVSLVRHPAIETKTISDERSAAFIALGIAQQTKKTVGLVCTSGSAAYNYAPAVAEAYYQQIPLLIVTADRPPEWIDQLDGQTIRQNNIYGSHVKNSYTLPADLSHPDARWHSERILSEAINLTQAYPNGPVHINIPLREPFYPNEEIVFDKKVKVIEEVSGFNDLHKEQWDKLHEEYKNFKKVLIIAGQGNYDPALVSSLSSISTHQNVPVIADVISNIPGEGIITFHDSILSSKDKDLFQKLKPDLIITSGMSVISKSLKTFLKQNKPQAHWLVQPGGYAADTFQSLTKVISVPPISFFKSMDDHLWKISSDYMQDWKHAELKIREKIWEYFNTESTPFTEFSALNVIINSLPSHSALHLANSMPVRYVNYITLKNSSPEIEVFSNRGTSGIDGVISTAFGAALSTEGLVTVISGDMAFFYDRNAWWNNYNPSNLRVIILNNHGGGIFRIIEGPSKQPELDEYFETKQKLTAGNTAKDYNLEYTLVKSEKELSNELKIFFEKSDKPKILEIETDSKTNSEAFKNFKNILNQ